MGRTFMPNNPAIRAPVPIPIVPMETYEEGRERGVDVQK